MKNIIDESIINSRCPSQYCYGRLNADSNGQIKCTICGIEVNSEEEYTKSMFDLSMDAFNSAKKSIHLPI